MTTATTCVSESDKPPQHALCHNKLLFVGARHPDSLRQTECYLSRIIQEGGIKNP
jgi:hypothetical protein